MTPESSPFRPGRPVPAEFFVGRESDIERLRGLVAASARNRVTTGFVTGERGIGKSTLAGFVRRLADRQHKAMGCHVYLGGVRNLREMLRKVFDGLLRASYDRPWYHRLGSFFGDRVRKVGMFGLSVELELRDRDLAAIERGFVQSMRDFLATIKKERRSLFLILDDINGLAASSEFANWLKSTVDEIATSERELPLCILLVGLEERRQQMIAAQPSLARVFDLINIAPWSDAETVEFYGTMFGKGGATISSADLVALSKFTRGLPVLAHEIGDAVWRAAPSPVIDKKSIENGFVTAAEIVGRKLLEPEVFHALRDSRYRAILQLIGERTDAGLMQFGRAELMERLATPEKEVLDSFLMRMMKLGVMQSDHEVRDAYRFSNLLYALYVVLREVRISGSAPRAEG